MDRSSIRAGAIAGGLATIALTGLLALASQVTRVSFLPFDLADLVIRLTPGDIATFGIEAFGSLAKLSIEAGSIVAFILIGAALGGLSGWWAARDHGRRRRASTGLSGILMLRVLLFVQLSNPSAAGLDTLSSVVLFLLALGWDAATAAM